MSEIRRIGWCPEWEERVDLEPQCSAGYDEHADCRQHGEFLLVRADLSDLDLDAAARPLHHWLGLWNPEWDDEQYEIIARAVVRAALGIKEEK